jgi:hypothetical protein
MTQLPIDISHNFLLISDFACNLPTILTLTQTRSSSFQVAASRSFNMGRLEGKNCIITGGAG